MNRLKDLLDIVTAAEVEGNARDHERMKLVLAGQAVQTLGAQPNLYQRLSLGQSQIVLPVRLQFKQPESLRLQAHHLLVNRPAVVAALAPPQKKYSQCQPR